MPSNPREPQFPSGTILALQLEDGRYAYLQIIEGRIHDFLRLLDLVSDEILAIPQLESAAPCMIFTMDLEKLSRLPVAGNSALLMSKASPPGGVICAGTIEGLRQMVVERLSQGPHQPEAEETADDGSIGFQYQLDNEVWANRVRSRLAKKLKAEGIEFDDDDEFVSVSAADSRRVTEILRETLFNALPKSVRTEIDFLRLGPGEPEEFAVVPANSIFIRPFPSKFHVQVATEIEDIMRRRKLDPGNLTMRIDGVSLSAGKETIEALEETVRIAREVLNRHLADDDLGNVRIVRSCIDGSKQELTVARQKNQEQ